MEWTPYAGVNGMPLSLSTAAAAAAAALV